VILSYILVTRHNPFLVFSVFTSGLASLLVYNRASVFLFMIFIFSPTVLTSAWTRRWCVPFNSNPFSFPWTFLVAYSKARMNSNGEKHLLFSEHLNRKFIRQIFAYVEFTLCFVQAHYINLTIFIYIYTFVFNENIVKYFSAERDVGLLEIYK